MLLHRHAGESFVRLHLHVGVRAAFAGVAHGPAFALVARVIAGRRWVCASAWAAEAVCERPGSRVGLWGAPCPRGVARLWLGVERGGFCTSCGSSRSSEADRATRLWTCVAAPARGGQVGGCSGGVQRLRNLGGRRGARAERDCGPNPFPGSQAKHVHGPHREEFRWAQRSARRARLRAERVTKGMPVLCPGFCWGSPVWGAPGTL